MSGMLRPDRAVRNLDCNTMGSYCSVRSNPTGSGALLCRGEVETDVLNRFSSAGDGEAKVQYLDGDFRVISPGAYVRCAVSGAKIPLEELKYWSVDRQEAYASPEAVLERHFPDATQSRTSAPAR
jgi:hypothetical protein